MNYYHVWPRSNRYHGSTPLTYAHSGRLKTGSIVLVELQKEKVPGLVSGPTPAPRFQTKPIERVYDLPPLPPQLIKLGQWLQTYYPAPLGLIAQQFLPPRLSEKLLTERPKALLGQPDISQLPPLTAEQSAAVEAMAETNSYVLHGLTGSGKTRLYIELALKAVAQGKSAIILTPEISLTSQLAANFRQVFGGQVIVMHSRQTPSERQQAWLGVLTAGAPVVVIGPRSALFSPVDKPGLIVLDESHEAAYKQEQAPHYQTSRAAAVLAGLARASLVLGSATPSVTDYYLAVQKHKPIVTLSGLALTAAQPAREVVLVDRKEHNLFSRSNHLSLPLIKAVETALRRGEQTLLYLNRRGTARMVMCEQCGWQALCPHCDLPLTYHGDSHTLRCHSCSYHNSAPAACPACGHPAVLYKTAGTKAIVQEAERLFPGARVARFDTDNIKEDRFEQHYERIARGEIDIIVGTQLLAKGLDLPRLSSLGVLLADTSLYLPDFSAQERTFQLLNQVLGRIGRGHVAGRAVIQTYHPDHPLIGYAIDHNYAAFYSSELASRQKFFFPPFCYLLKLTVRRATARNAEEAAGKFKHELGQSGLKIQVEGPAPAFHERFQNKYQWQLVVKAVDRAELLKVIAQLPPNWSFDIDPLDLL